MADGPHAGGAALREIAVVLAVASAGLVLVVLAAFAPWYDRGAGTAVVEMRAPSVASVPAGEPAFSSGEH